MTKWKAAQASVPVSQRIMVLTDGAASSNILSWWAPNSCDDKVFSVSSHFHNLVSISIRTSSSNNWLLTFLKLFAWSGKAIKSPMDPEMNIKSWLLQRTAAFEVNVLKHVKYTSAVQQKREYFKRILSSTSVLLPSSLKCSVYQTACWARKVSREGRAQCGVALTCDRDAEEDSALVAPYFGFTVIRRELATLPIHLLYSWHQATLVPFNPSAE